MIFPLSEKTAWQLALRALVMVPLAESPSVMKMEEFSTSSWFFAVILSV